MLPFLFLSCSLLARSFLLGRPLLCALLVLAHLRLSIVSSSPALPLFLIQYTRLLTQNTRLRLFSSSPAFLIQYTRLHTSCVLARPLLHHLHSWFNTRVCIVLQELTFHSFHCSNFNWMFELTFFIPLLVFRVWAYIPLIALTVLHVWAYIPLIPLLALHVWAYIPSFHCSCFKIEMFRI